MSDFIQGGYNKYEHDFTERTDEQLQEKLADLNNTRSYASSGARREQIDKTMTHIAFELSERLRESKNESIEQAWQEYDNQHGERIIP